MCVVDFDIISNFLMHNYGSFKIEKGKAIPVQALRVPGG
jgi:hypothetical protein